MAEPLNLLPRRKPRGLRLVERLDVCRRGLCGDMGSLLRVSLRSLIALTAPMTFTAEESFVEWKWMLGMCSAAK